MARPVVRLPNADNRRQGILRLADYNFARRDPYTARYAQIGTRDPNPLVRAAALRALNRSRDQAAAQLYRHSLDDADPLVRLEAAKALANIPDDTAVILLAKHLDDDQSIDVRIACADALRNFKTLEASRALVEALGDRDFSIGWQARQSLTLLTGRDFRYDRGQWLEYFTTSVQPFP